MPYTTDHGVPDIDATHAWTPVTGPTPPVINDHGNPWIKLLGAPGMHDGPESDDNREPRTIQDGEIVYPGFKLGRTFTLNCEAQAENELDMRLMLTTARRGFTFNMVDEGLMTVVPYSGVGGPTWTYHARVIAFDPADDFTWERNRVWKFRWPFAITLRMSDPLYYSSSVGYV